MEPTNTQPAMHEVSKDTKGHGALIASIVIVLVLVVGAVYYYTSMKEVRKDRMDAQYEETYGEDTVSANLQIQSDSDDTQSIGNDLEATDYTDFDQGM